MIIIISIGNSHLLAKVMVDECSFQGQVTW